MLSRLDYPLMQCDAGAASLPPELTRILATVKDLDERSYGA